MSWISSPLSNTAEHVETGSKFSIRRLSNHVKGIDDIEIAPVGNDGKRWSNEEIFQLKTDLWSHWEHQLLRDELSTLIRKHFLGECDRAASAISSVTGKKVSTRTIQSWLIDLGKPSSRTCPQWAVKALKAYLDDPKNQAVMEWLQLSRKDVNRQFPSALDMTINKSVEMATREMEFDNREFEAWKKIGLTELPEKLFEEFGRLRRENSSMSKALGTISRGIETAENFEQFREFVRQKMRDDAWRDGEIRRTRRAIEERLEEFANPEGLAG